MTFANDSLHTSLCLQFDPKEIATACVYLGCNFIQARPMAGKDWLEVLDDPNVEALASISLQLLVLIAERKGTDQAIVAKIRQYLDQIVNNTNREIKSEEETTTKVSATSTSAAPKPDVGVPPDSKRQRTG